MVFGFDICAHPWRVAYFVVAVVASVAIGFYGPQVLGKKDPELKATFLFDCWLNFVGAAFGWGATYAVVKMLVSWSDAGVGSAIVVLAAALPLAFYETFKNFLQEWPFLEDDQGLQDFQNEQEIC
jgi:hypothetical protein